jgi:hypothetical protein
MFNHHLLNGLPKEIKGEYDVVDVGYKFRVEDGYKSFKKFLKNKNNGYILEKIFLLKKKFNSSKRGDTPKSLRHKESRREGFNNAVDEKP